MMTLRKFRSEIIEDMSVCSAEKYERRSLPAPVQHFELDAWFHRH